MQARSEDTPEYAVTPAPAVSASLRQREDHIIAKALGILGRRIGEQRYNGPHGHISGPADIKNFLALSLGQREHEVFGVIWLTLQHDVIVAAELFRGTLGSASVYPREIVKAGLAVNAGAAVLYHNHPSGLPEPSEADKHLTRNLKEALALVDIKVLDHLLVAGTQTMSFAERGLI